MRNINSARIRSHARVGFATSMLFAVCAGTAAAQTIECGRFNSETNRITFQFTQTFKRQSVSNSRVTVMRIRKAGEPLPDDCRDPTRVCDLLVEKIAIAERDQIQIGEEELPNSVGIVLPGGKSINADELYLIHVEGLQFGDKTPRLTAQFKNNAECGKPGPEQTPEGRADANVYISGTLSTASGTDLHGTLDTKLRRTVYQTDTEENPDPSVISDVGLIFDFKASGDPKADPDSMNFGVEWEMDLRKANDKGPLNYLFLYLYPKIESERDFGNTNVLLEQSFKLGLRRPIRKPWAPVFSPFIGQELGKNLQSPLDEAEGSGIYRLKAGTFFNLFFEPGLTGVQKIEIDAEYTRRWPLRRELRFQEDKEKNLTLLEITKRPRDYVRANLNFFFRNDFGATVGYEFGELPPSFKLVDHKLKIGLVFKTK